MACAVASWWEVKIYDTVGGHASGPCQWAYGYSWAQRAVTRWPAAGSSEGGFKEVAEDWPDAG
jgi:hypothetical protein